MKSIKAWAVFNKNGDVLPGTINLVEDGQAKAKAIQDAENGMEYDWEELVSRGYGVKEIVITRRISEHESNKEGYASVGGMRQRIV